MLSDRESIFQAAASVCAALPSSGPVKRHLMTVLGRGQFSFGCSGSCGFSDVRRIIF